MTSREWMKPWARYVEVEEEAELELGLKEEVTSEELMEVCARSVEMEAEEEVEEAKQELEYPDVR